MVIAVQEIVNYKTELGSSTFFTLFSVGLSDLQPLLYLIEFCAACLFIGF